MGFLLNEFLSFQNESEFGTAEDQSEGPCRMEHNADRKNDQKFALDEDGRLSNDFFPSMKYLYSRLSIQPDDGDQFLLTDTAVARDIKTKGMLSWLDVLRNHQRPPTGGCTKTSTNVLWDSSSQPDVPADKARLPVPSTVKSESGGGCVWNSDCVSICTKERDHDNRDADCHIARHQPDTSIPRPDIRKLPDDKNGPLYGPCGSHMPPTSIDDYNASVRNMSSQSCGDNLTVGVDGIKPSATPAGTPSMTGQHGRGNVNNDQTADVCDGTNGIMKTVELNMDGCDRCQSPTIRKQHRRGGRSTNTQSSTHSAKGQPVTSSQRAPGYNRPELQHTPQTWLGVDRSPPPALVAPTVDSPQTLCVSGGMNPAVVEQTVVKEPSKCLKEHLGLVDRVSDEGTVSPCGIINRVDPPAIHLRTSTTEASTEVDNTTSDSPTTTTPEILTSLPDHSPSIHVPVMGNRTVIQSHPVELPSGSDIHEDINGYVSLFHTELPISPSMIQNLLFMCDSDITALSAPSSSDFIPSSPISENHITTTNGQRSVSPRGYSPATDRGDYHRQVIDLHTDYNYRVPILNAKDDLKIDDDFYAEAHLHRTGLSCTGGDDGGECVVVPEYSSHPHQINLMDNNVGSEVATAQPDEQCQEVFATGDLEVSADPPNEYLASKGHTALTESIGTFTPNHASPQPLGAATPNKYHLSHSTYGNTHDNSNRIGQSTSVKTENVSQPIGPKRLQTVTHGLLTIANSEVLPTPPPSEDAVGKQLGKLRSLLNKPFDLYTDEQNVVEENLTRQSEDTRANHPPHEIQRHYQPNCHIESSGPGSGAPPKYILHSAGPPQSNNPPQPERLPTGYGSDVPIERITKCSVHPTPTTTSGKFGYRRAPISETSPHEVKQSYHFTTTSSGNIYGHDMHTTGYRHVAHAVPQAGCEVMGVIDEAVKDGACAATNASHFSASAYGDRQHLATHANPKILSVRPPHTAGLTHYACAPATAAELSTAPPGLMAPYTFKHNKLEGHECHNFLQQQPPRPHPYGPCWSTYHLPPYPIDHSQHKLHTSTTACQGKQSLTPPAGTEREDDFHCSDGRYISTKPKWLNHHDITKDGMYCDHLQMSPFVCDHLHTLPIPHAMQMNDRINLSDTLQHGQYQCNQTQRSQKPRFCDRQYAYRAMVGEPPNVVFPDDPDDFPAASMSNTIGGGGNDECNALLSMRTNAHPTQCDYTAAYKQRNYTAGYKQGAWGGTHHILRNSNSSCSMKAIRELPTDTNQRLSCAPPANNPELYGHLYRCPRNDAVECLRTSTKPTGHQKQHQAYTVHPVVTHGCQGPSTLNTVGSVSSQHRLSYNSKTPIIDENRRQTPTAEFCPLQCDTSYHPLRSCLLEVPGPTGWWSGGLNKNLRGTFGSLSIGNGSSAQTTLRGLDG